MSGETERSIKHCVLARLLSLSSSNISFLRRTSALLEAVQTQKHRIMTKKRAGMHGKLYQIRSQTSCVTEGIPYNPLPKGVAGHRVVVLSQPDSQGRVKIATVRRIRTYIYVFTHWVVPFRSPRALKTTFDIILSLPPRAGLTHSSCTSATTTISTLALPERFRSLPISELRSMWYHRKCFWNWKETSANIWCWKMNQLLN